jgi:hypothetical protein
LAEESARAQTQVAVVNPNSESDPNTLAVETSSPVPAPPPAQAQAQAQAPPAPPQSTGVLSSVLRNKSPGKYDPNLENFQTFLLGFVGCVFCLNKQKIFVVSLSLEILEFSNFCLLLVVAVILIRITVE